MEFDFGEVGLRHLEHIVAVGEEDVAPLFVCGHELVFALLESCQCLLVVALYPARFVEADRLPAALRAVFMQQTILYHLELKLTDSADDLAPVELIGEHLRHTFIHKLIDTLVELLGFHRIGILYIFEHLGREAGQPLEVKHFAGGQGVADLEVAGVRDTNDVAGIPSDPLLHSLCKL